jgi:hypothetical protein
MLPIVGSKYLSSKLSLLETSLGDASLIVVAAGKDISQTLFENLLDIARLIFKSFDFLV